MTRTLVALAVTLFATSALAQGYNRQELVRGLCQKDGCDEFTILATDRIRATDEGTLFKTRLKTFHPGFPRQAAHPGTFVDRIVSTTTCAQRQEADCPVWSAPTPACIRETAPVLLIQPHFGRRSPVRFDGGALRRRGQHRATGLGRRPSIISSMRRNRSRGTATSAIWNTV